MSNSRAPQALASSSTFAVGLVGIALVAFVSLASTFATHQRVWVDETTQLSGLTLSPGEQVRWLAGEDRQRFGVPGDRMPPLSYWLGGAWAAVFGLSEPAMRGFGIATTSLGLLAFAAAAWSAAGPRAGAIVTLALALSGSVFTRAVEIRAYNLFFALSCAASWAFVRCLRGPDPPSTRDLLGLGAACTAAAYTHFYGVVLAVSFWTSLMATAWLRKRAIRAIGIGVGLELVALAALVPFVRSAVAMSSGDEGTLGVASFAVDLARALVHMLVHPAANANPLLTVAGLAGAAVLTSMALLLPARAELGDRSTDEDTERRWIAAGLGSTVLLGLGAPVVAWAIAPAFSALRPSYNLWLVPPVYLWIAVGVARARAEPWVHVRAAALVGLFACTLYASSWVARYPERFTHGFAGTLRTAVEAHHPAWVVHSTEWGHSYFPLRYQYGSALRQMVVTGDGKLLELPALTPVEDRPPPGATVLSAAVHHARSAEIFGYVRSGTIELPTPPSPELWAPAGQGASWHPGDEVRHVSYLAGVVMPWTLVSNGQPAARTGADGP